jgi:hypothetical protein
MQFLLLLVALVKQP